MERTCQSSDPTFRSPTSSLAQSLPTLDFRNPFSPTLGSLDSCRTDAAAFLPLHMEKAYAYPLVVWLGEGSQSDFRLSKVMPKISVRNYVGIAPTLGKNFLMNLDAGDKVFECVDRASWQYNIHSGRIFLAGYGAGGSLAFQLAMTHSEYFAGAISLGGALPIRTSLNEPTHPSLMGDLRSIRKTPIFLTQSRQDRGYNESEFCDDIRALHVAGFSVTARQYPGTQIVNDQMLHDIDVWMMEIINGYDMTTSDETSYEIS